MPLVPANTGLPEDPTQKINTNFASVWVRKNQADISPN
jgi:hypothetical protein